MATRKDFEDFNCEELEGHLSDVLSGEISSETLEQLKKNKITGKSFLELNDDDLREVAKLLGERKALKRVILSYTTRVSTSSTQNLISTVVSVIYTCVYYSYQVNIGLWAHRVEYQGGYSLEVSLACYDIKMQGK